MPELNVELVKRVRQHIFDHPENFDMSDWINSPLRPRSEVMTEDALLDCGTTACLAGTAIALVAADERVSFDDAVAEYGACDCGHPGCGVIGIGIAGRVVLGLDADTADVIFDGRDWPDPYAAKGEWQGAIDLLDDLAAGKPVL